MDVISMPGLRSADSYRTWADLRDVLFEIVSATTLEQFSIESVAFSSHFLPHVIGLKRNKYSSAHPIRFQSYTNRDLVKRIFPRLA